MAKYTKDYLLQQLIDYYETFNKIPVSTKFHIHQNIYRKYFGNWNNALKAANIPTFNKTNKITTICKECKSTFLQTPSQNKRFCSKSCSTKYSNKNRQHTTETKLKLRKKVKERFPPHSNIRFLVCEVCNTQFYLRANKRKYCHTRKTCSSECHSKLLSINAKKRNLGGNWNRSSMWYTSPFAGRIHLESSWELILAKDLDTNFINWIRPTNFFSWITEEGTTHKYYPDFYLPDYGYYLDPKNDFLQQQDAFKINYVINNYNISLLILSETQLSWKAVKELIGAGGEI